GSSATGSLHVDTKTLLVTVDGASKPYGTDNPAFTVHYFGFVLGQGPGDLSGSLTFSTTAAAASHVGSYTVDASGLSSTNYATPSPPGRLAVTRVELPITADNKTMPRGAPLPTLPASSRGFANGDPPANLTPPPMLATAATSNSAPGSYQITVSGAAAI